MKRFLLAGASLLALLAGTPAEAATLVFGYTGAIVPYVVPETARTRSSLGAPKVEAAPARPWAASAPRSAATSVS
jgi:hypothetical protein